MLSSKDANGDPITGATSFAIANPFRYRGYYYDRDSGLYYLQSRYYDPTTGRFVNADALAYITSDSFVGLNLFAYADNNCVNRADYNGTAAVIPFVKLVGIVLISYTALVVVTSIISSPSFQNGLQSSANTISNTISNFSTPSNTKNKNIYKSSPKASVPKGHMYKLAYINKSGDLIKIGKGMTFVEALTVLGVKKSNIIIKEKI